MHGERQRPRRDGGFLGRHTGQRWIFLERQRFGEAVRHVAERRHVRRRADFVGEDGEAVHGVEESELVPRFGIRQAEHGKSRIFVGLRGGRPVGLRPYGLHRHEFLGRPEERFDLHLPLQPCLPDAQQPGIRRGRRTLQDIQRHLRFAASLNCGLRRKVIGYASTAPTGLASSAAAH